MATTFINTGAIANDNTGDTIRSAFTTVNDNFDLINGAVFAGIKSTIISAASVTSGIIVSNTSILANTWVNANSIVGNTVTSYGNLYVSKDGAYIVGNVNIIGNLNVSGSQAASQSQQSGSPILSIHYSATPLILNDGKDIGFEWQYYTGTEKRAFLGWQNSTGTLIYQDDITDTANVITAGTFGNVQFGSLTLSNSTVATSNTSGALSVTGGISTQGNLYVAGNVVATFANIGNLSVKGNVVGSMYFSGADTIYIGGSPVVTSATSFNGGPVGLETQFNSTTPTTALGSGALRVVGGFSANGNVYVGGNIVVANVGGVLGNITGNIVGNILSPSQPSITSLGELSVLNMGGTINSQNIIPELNLTYNLGSSNTTRWNKLWVYDIDSTGVILGSNVNLSVTSNPGIITNQSTAFVFNEIATTIKIGGGGVSEFDSNTQSISNSTGAVVVKGGLGINTGNLYIGGSGGRAITHTGHIVPSANLTFDLGSTTAWYNTFYGVSTQAKYADLAEKYLPDDIIDYTPGTVVVFGGEKEITVTEQFADHRVAGVISTEPAYLMNAAVEGVPVALRGRVPVKVINEVNKGDLLVTASVPGYAMSVGSDTSYGIKIFAKSLETNLSSGSKIIEAVII